MKLWSQLGRTRVFQSCFMYKSLHVSHIECSIHSKYVILERLFLDNRFRLLDRFRWFVLLRVCISGVMSVCFGLGTTMEISILVAFNPDFLICCTLPCKSITLRPQCEKILRTWLYFKDGLLVTMYVNTKLVGFLLSVMKIIPGFVCERFCVDVSHSAG